MQFQRMFRIRFMLLCVCVTTIQFRIILQDVYAQMHSSKMYTTTVCLQRHFLRRDPDEGDVPRAAETQLWFSVRTKRTMRMRKLCVVNVFKETKMLVWCV